MELAKQIAIETEATPLQGKWALSITPWLQKQIAEHVQSKAVDALMKNIQYKPEGVKWETEVLKTGLCVKTCKQGMRKFVKVTTAKKPSALIDARAIKHGELIKPGHKKYDAKAMVMVSIALCEEDMQLVGNWLGGYNTVVDAKQLYDGDYEITFMVV